MIENVVLFAINFAGCQCQAYPFRIAARVKVSLQQMVSSQCVTLESRNFAYN
ncbi:MAG: hypothetical protein ACR5LA_10295 [Wolbachia sp.]